MTERDERDVSSLRFFELLPGKFVAPPGSLAGLSGDHSLARPGYFPSGLQKRVAGAWSVELKEITCTQVRVLIGQTFGLQWLAEPVVAFVSLYPAVQTELYPGDLAKAALRAFSRIHDLAPEAAHAMMGADFDWMYEVFDYDPTAVEEARDLVAAARALADSN